MKIQRTIIAGTIAGAVVAGVIAGVYLFGFAGPGYERSSAGSSEREMWPLVAIALTLMSMVWGAILGAVVAAMRTARPRIALFGAGYGLVSAGLIVKSGFQNDLGRGFWGVMLGCIGLGLASALLSLVLDVVMGQASTRP